MKRGFLLLFCCALLLMGGCLGAKSADEYGYVLMLGVDEGKDAPFYVTMLLQKGSGGDETDATADSALTTGVSCGGLHEAVELLEGSLPFELELSRTTAIVFGEGAARSGSAAKEFLGASMGSLGIRHYANIMVAKGAAWEFLTGLNSDTAPNLAKLQQSFLEYSNVTGLTPVTTLGEFYEGTWSTVLDPVVPLGEFREDFLNQDAVKEESLDGVKEATLLQSNLSGCALFDGPYMTGALSGEQTQLLLMARGEFRSGRMHIPDPEGLNMSVSLKSGGMPKLTLSLSDPPEAAFMIFLEATVERPATVASTDADELEAHIAAYIEEGLQKTFALCQDAGADSFGIGRAAVRQFSSAAKWEEYEWEREFPKTTAEFQVTVTLNYNPSGSRME